MYSEYMSNHQVSQRRLAMQVGVSPPHMNALVKGKRRPSPQLAAKIEAITGIPLRTLLGLDLPDGAQPERSNDMNTS